MSNNLRYPAEWEKHKSTIICWPHQKEDWPGKFMPIHWVYTEIVKYLVRGEIVRIIVQSKNHQDKVKSYLNRAHVPFDNVDFIVAKTDRGWMRDSSPSYVKVGNKTKAIEFTFNGWAKYTNHKLDRKIPNVLAKHLEIEIDTAIHKNRNVVLEGGAIDINGKGTLLTTEECLLDEKIQTRNPGFTKNDYENVFEKYLGIKNTIWLKNGITGDDTHGHVDDLCRFVNHNTLLICNEDNTSDTNYKPLKENLEILENVKLEEGSKPNVVKLPMPSPIIFEGMRLPASYANFYISNYAVLVPTFNDPNDRIALNIIKEFFPDRAVIGIHAVDLVWGLGTIHCLSHEEPL
ncbi:MAG: agmatine deiminase family protein [Ignavibacteriales bacterium]|nr:agmatine deiminase family protein [Ignavibacteriales bacterium]